MSNRQPFRTAPRRDLRGARILVIEDEPAVADLVKQELTRSGAEVKTAPSGENGLRCAAEWFPHAVVLDLRLGDSHDPTGLEICRELSQRWRDIKIVIFSIDPNQKQAAVRAGACAYIVKAHPLPLRDLRAKLTELLSSSGVVFNFERHEAFIGGRTVSLSAKQCQVLSLLSRHPGAIITDDDIIEQCWGPEYVSDAARANMRDFMVGLRRAIEPDPTTPRYLCNHLGLGYSFSLSTTSEPRGDRFTDL